MKSLLPKIWKKISKKKALAGGCLLKPQSKLLPQANASIVSSGKLLFVSEGANVHTIKCNVIKIWNILSIFFLLSNICHFLYELTPTWHPLIAEYTPAIQI